jgi:hypothetical protein
MILAGLVQMLRSFFSGGGRLGRGLASSEPLDPEAQRRQFGSEATISELGGLRPDPSPVREDRGRQHALDAIARDAARARAPHPDQITFRPPSQVDREILPPAVRERGAAARRARLRLAQSGLVTGRRGLTGENDIRGGERDTRRAAAIARRKPKLGSSVVLGEKGG